MPEPYFSTDLLGNNPNYQWVFDNSRPVYAEYAQPQYSMEIADMSNNSPATPPQKSTNWSNIGQYVIGGMNLATAALQDITDILGNTKSQINDKPSYDFSQTNTFDDLSHNNLHLASTSQLTRPTFGSSFMDINMRTARGAIAGAALGLGPWGALGGAIGGTLAGVGNSIAKATTYNRDINRLNRLNDQAITNYHNDFTKAFNDINNKPINMTNLQRSRNMFAEGGNINTTIQTGGTHEENPFGGVQLGVDAQGTPNLVEEGEVIYNDYVFSNRIKPNKAILQQFNTLFKKSFNSYADIANHINNLHKDYIDDPMHNQTKNVQMQRLAQAQDYQKVANEAAEYGLTPEEYLEQQNTSAEELSNQYAQGGEIYTVNSKYDQNKLVRHYYRENPEKAYYLDRLGYLIDIAQHRALEPQEQENLQWYMSKALPILKTDPKAQVYLKDRIGLSNQVLNAFLAENNIPTSHGVPTNHLSATEKRIERRNYPAFNDRPSSRAQFQFNSLPTHTNSSAVSQNNTTVRKETVPTTPTNVSNVGIDRNILNNRNLNTINNTTYQYYNPATKSYISQDQFEQLPSEQQQLLYRIGNKGGRGYDGRIDYNDSQNTAYNDKYTRLTDDDWNQIKTQLGDAYNNYDINRLKAGGADNLFGNIHKAAIDYIWNRDYNTPNTPIGQPAPVIQSNIVPDTSTTNQIDNPTQPINTTQPTSKFASFMGMNNPLRYAPVFDNARSLIEQNNPDYTYSNQLASLYQPLDYNPIGERMRYTPVDQYYLANQAEIARNTQMGAYRNNANTNQGNAYMNSMVNQQANNLIGDNYMKALQQNEQIRNQTLQYNNQLDAQNEANRLNIQAQNASNYAQIMGNSYQAAEEERLAVENAREANKQNMAANLGLIGKEQSDYYNVNHNPALMYGAFGTFYKGLTPDQQKSFNNIWNTTFNK